MNNSIVTIIYIAFIVLVRQAYKRHIERKHKYVIPMKKNFGVDRNITHYDEEVINNKKLKAEINHLFIAENIGVAIMLIGAMCSLLN